MPSPSPQSHSVPETSCVWRQSSPAVAKYTHPADNHAIASQHASASSFEHRSSNTSEGGKVIRREVNAQLSSFEAPSERQSSREGSAGRAGSHRVRLTICYVVAQISHVVCNRYVATGRNCRRPEWVVGSSVCRFVHRRQLVGSKLTVGSILLIRP